MVNIYETIDFFYYLKEQKKTITLNYISIQNMANNTMINKKEIKKKNLFYFKNFENFHFFAAFRGSF